MTDHQALKAILNTPQPSGKLARWGLAIQELDADIVYRSGKSNSNADALSRNPIVDPSDVTQSVPDDEREDPCQVEPTADQSGGVDAIERGPANNHTQPDMVNARWQGPVGEQLNTNNNTHTNRTW